MRSIVVEVLLVTLAAVLLVSGALALIPGIGEGSWLARSGTLVAAALTFNFGYSTVAHEWVRTAVFNAAAKSVIIIAGTALLLVAIGVPMGVVAATHSSSWIVRSVQRAIKTISSLPLLVWSTTVFLVAVWTYHVSIQGDTAPVGAIAAAILALFLGDRLLSDFTQRVELSTREIVAEPYMRTARAADLGFRRHLVQSLVPPIAELIAARSMVLIGGAIVVERVFGIRGLGYTVVSALEQREREPQLILAASLALVVIGLVFRVIQRTAIWVADPRVRS